MSMKALYHNLYVSIATETPQEITFNEVAGIRLNKYLMAAFKAQPGHAAQEDRRREFMRQHYSWVAKTFRRLRQRREDFDPLAVSKAYSGKGWPEDYEWALTLAASTGLCQPTQHAIQTYCDAHLGIDCSGFVNAYFNKKGKIAGRSYLLISAYARGTRRNNVNDVRQDDCLAWTDSDGNLKSNPGHIALVQRVIIPTNLFSAVIAGVSIHVIESTGRIGLCDSLYQVRQRKETRRNGVIFQVYRPLKNSLSWVRIVQAFP